MSLKINIQKYLVTASSLCNHCVGIVPLLWNLNHRRRRRRGRRKRRWGSNGFQWRLGHSLGQVPVHTANEGLYSACTLLKRDNFVHANPQRSRMSSTIALAFAGSQTQAKGLTTAPQPHWTPTSTIFPTVTSCLILTSLGYISAVERKPLYSCSQFKRWGAATTCARPAAISDITLRLLSPKRVWII